MLGHRSHGEMCSLISPLQGIINALLNGQLVLTKRLSFLHFSRQITEKKFQLKSTILRDITLNKTKFKGVCNEDTSFTKTPCRDNPFWCKDEGGRRRYHRVS